jgi:hypothetical protein
MDHGPFRVADGELILRAHKMMMIMMMIKGTKIISERLIPFHPMSHCVSITKTYRLMLFREIIAVYSKSHIKHVHTVGRQNTKM